MTTPSRPRRPLLFAASLCVVFAVTALAALLPGYEADPRVRLVVAGDIMLDCEPGRAIAEGVDPFADFADVLRDADIAVGNLECVVATAGRRMERSWTFRAHPRVLDPLARHFQAVSLANNHTGDFGHDAFREMLGLLKAHPLAYFGGGRDSGEARTPLIVERRGLRIALLGYNEFRPRSQEAGPDTPGVAWSSDEQVIADLEAARRIHKADLVIPYMHWGWEEYPANDRQKELARLMIDHGADLVVGTHPHITQGVEYYKGKLIVYSLGNFVFDGFKREELKIGWLLRATLSRQGLVEWDTVVSRLDERGIPHRAPGIPSPRGRRGELKIQERAYREE